MILHPLPFENSKYQAKRGGEEELNAFFSLSNGCGSDPVITNNTCKDVLSQHFLANSPSLQS